MHTDEEPGSAAATLPDPFLAFLRLFNDGRYWDSHEALEDAWRETGSGFYHGLILYASAFVHARRENAHGIRAQLEKAERALAPFAPDYLGLDVQAILEHARRCREIVRRGEAAGDVAGEGGSAGDGPERGDTDRRWRESIPFPELRPERTRIRGDERELG